MDQYEQYLEKINTMNKESAKTQMDFQERLSSTAHQREVKDLIAAGLNPVLSANNGASSPAGAYANVDSSAVSAKFARQNLERELSNARTIAMMNNENALKIAREQMMMNYNLGIYQADKSYDASVYSSDMNKLIEQMKVDNPTSIAGVLSKLVSSFMGDESMADTARKAGKTGIFDYFYGLAKRMYDGENGYQFSARRAQDIKNFMAKERAIIAKAKMVSNEVIRSGGDKKAATEAYRKVLNDYGYYKYALFNTGANAIKNLRRII